MRDWLASLTHVEVPLLFVVLLRLGLGYVLVSQGRDKIHQGFLEAVKQPNVQQVGPLYLTLRMWIQEERKVYAKGDSSAGPTERTIRMFEWYRFFLDNAVIPHAPTFAVLVTVGELALGGLLLVGLAVRMIAPLTMLLCANYLLATWHLGFPFTSLNILFLVALAVVTLAGAGRSLGLDGFLHERFPEIPIF